MERYVTQDGSVAKYVHDDGSETSIKTWPKGMESCGGSGRDKFNVFASCSSGCEVKCGFCFLTSKGFKYHRLTHSQIELNVIKAIQQEQLIRPELREIPMNLSWMGMGDAFMDMNLIYNATDMIIKTVAPWVKQIEGVDIATTLPIIRYDDIDVLKKINQLLIDTQKLTDKPIERSNVRIFYSLHSVNNKTRQTLIPKTINVWTAMEHLRSIETHFNVIYHYMFLDGINDSIEQMYEVLDFVRNNDIQLRVLRFNECPNTKFKESLWFDGIIEKLYKYIPNNLKVQLSPGSEVSAACGMFLMKSKK